MGIWPRLALPHCAIILDHAGETTTSEQAGLRKELGPGDLVMAHC